MSDKISVAMAVYNGSKYIRQQIDSILPQLREGDELIISYDESQDDTLEIIRTYERKDARVKVFTDPGSGVTDNFNNAISHCTGDYIFLSDQDDVWLDGKVERLMRCFHERSPDLIIHNGVPANEELEPESASYFEIYRIGDGKLRNILKPRYSGCCMAFTKKMKESILPMPEIEGYDQWIATVCEFLGRIEYVEDVLLLHRIHGHNVTPRTSRPLPVILKMRTRLIWHPETCQRAEKGLKACFMFWWSCIT